MATVAFTVSELVTYGSGVAEIRVSADGRNRAYCQTCKSQIHKLWMRHDPSVAKGDAVGHLARRHP